MPVAPHVIDTDRAEMIRKLRDLEKEVATLEGQIESERGLVINSDTFTGTRMDPLKQWGTRIAHTDFENKIRPFLPSNVFIADHPTNPAMRWIYQVIPEGQVYVTAYAKGLMPEFSIHFAKESVRPVAGLYKKRLKDVGGIALSRLDMPKMKAVRNDAAPGGFESVPVDEDAVMPGWRKENEIGPERVRGWRTVLIYLRGQGMMTLAQCETLFGSADTPEWQGHMGKAKVTTKW